MSPKWPWDLSGLTIPQLLQLHDLTARELERRQVTRGKNVTGEVGERIAHAMYGGELARKVKEGYDLIDLAGRRVQVKTRKAAEAGSSNSKRFGAMAEPLGFDACFFLLIEPETFRPVLARELSPEEVRGIWDDRGIKVGKVSNAGQSLLAAALAAWERVGKSDIESV